MAVHAMIDLETLGTKPDCTIISLGAIILENMFCGKYVNIA